MNTPNLCAMKFKLPKGRFDVNPSCPHCENSDKQRSQVEILRRITTYMRNPRKLSLKCGMIKHEENHNGLHII